MKVKLNNSHGFTILELLFFVVISASLVVIPFTILQGRNSDVQFSDAARTVQAFMQREYNNTLNGVNDGNKNCRYNGKKFDFKGTQDNDGSCIFLGTVMEFGDLTTTSDGDEVRRKIRVYRIIGINKDHSDELREDYIDCKSSLPSGLYESRKVMSCIQPTVMLDTSGNEIVTEYDIPWGAEMFREYNSNSMAFFRDPTKSRIIPVGYHSGFRDYGDASVFETSSKDEVLVDAEYSGHLCLKSQGASKDSDYARLGLGYGARQEVIDLKVGSLDCVE